MTGTDSGAAATDLADALEAFADLAVAPGTVAGGGVWLTIGAPYGIEQRTVRLPVGAADWITEFLRDETRTLEPGTGAADGGSSAGDDGQDAGLEPAWLVTRHSRSVRLWLPDENGAIAQAVPEEGAGVDRSAAVAALA
nr:hypothetical protein KitaXyl93_76910 [Kitasatospora sp. Xyl93]